jgi:acetyl esterase/lipase
VCVCDVEPDTGRRATFEQLEQLFADWFAGISPNEEVAPGITVRAYQHLLTPAPAPRGRRWCPDVVYGKAGRDGRDLVADLYSGVPGERSPGIVFIHGGGWRGGHRYMLIRQAAEMAANGYVTATIDYRLSGEAPWPAALEDAKCAVRWMRKHADEVGVDPAQIVVVGGSAGGHLAALVALTSGLLEGAGGWADVSSEVNAAVLYEPVLDLREAAVSDALRPLVEAFLNDYDDLASDASPITRVTADCPPVLTRVGEHDETTPVAPCEAFHRLLDEVHVPNQLEILPGKSHGVPVYDHCGCIRAITAFLADHLQTLE